MSGAEFLAESKLNSLDDNDENKWEEEIEPSSIIYCNDLSITDDEVDSDGSYEEAKSLKFYGKLPELSSKRPENFTNEGMSKTIRGAVKDTGKHPNKILPCLSSTANFSKFPLNQMKEKSFKDPHDLYHVTRVHSSPDALDTELPLEVRSIPSQPGNNYSSINKNVAFPKMTDSIKGTPDPDHSNTRKILKSAKSDKSKDGGSNQTWYFDMGKVTKSTTKKAKEKRKTKGSKYRQMLRKRYRGISRKYGNTYLGQPKILTPISILKRYAEQYKVDFAKLMENIDSIGLDVPFPCNECYFKKKTGDTYSNPFEMITNMLEKRGVPMDKKCPDCGVERMSLGGYGKMIANLRRMIEYRNLVVHDVFPDGNCLYAAIVDQLRIRGDFSWTYKTLRTCAVEYLRENPCEEDGTHKQMYLDRETWEEYLERNSEDGEWGDHIMMSAIVEVLQRKIVILGGVSGKARNIIVPKSICPVHKPKEGGEPTSTQPMDTKVENRKEDLVEEVEKKKKKETRDEIRNEDKMEGEKKEEEDKETKKKRMREEAIQRKEKEDDELEDETCLYLGHLSESHYISLRKRGWANVSQEKMIDQTQRRKQELKKENPDLFQMGNEIDYSKDVSDKNEIDPLSKEPFLHLDFIIKQMLEGYFETSPMVVQPLDNDMYTFELQGSKYENMYPLLNGEKTLTGRCASDELLFCFPDSCETKEAKMNILGEDMLFYCTPSDTRVHEKDFQNVATASDLIEEPVRNLCGTLYLIPKKSKIWRGHLTENKDGKICLEHILLTPKLVSLAASRSDVSQASVRQIIAFKCQWPAEAAEWISRERPVNWPPAKVVEEIINYGCHVIPVAHGEPIKGMDIDAMTWEYTFYGAEKSLLWSSISKHQQTCFFIFQLLVEKQLQVSQPVLLYQVLKNIFLFACEIFDDNMWSKRPGFCILHMLSRLVSCLDKGEAPMYFMPCKNIIKCVPRETTLTQAQQLEVLRLNPIISIYWLLDEYNLTSSDVGVTIDDVIADLGRFAEHHNLKKSKADMILPASLETATDHIELMEYSSAFQVIMDIFEELADHDQLKEDISIADFVKDNFSDLDIGHLWCLALHVDLNAGTNLVPDICLEYECVSISFLFGPEIIEYLGDKPVPNIFVQSWDLKFAKNVVIVLRSVDKYKEITVGLRYFLDTLEDFVTEKSFTGSYYDPSLFTKVNMYIELYNAYCKCNEVSEFADLLERFEKLAFKLDNMDAYLHLSEMCRKLGKRDLMKKAKLKAVEKYESGNYVDYCVCGECKFTLSSSDLGYEDDLPPKGIAKKNKFVTSSDENKETARSRPYGRYNMENSLLSNDESNLEESPFDMLQLPMRLGNMRMRSPAGRSRGSSMLALMLSPYDSFGYSGYSGSSDNSF